MAENVTAPAGSRSSARRRPSRRSPSSTTTGSCSARPLGRHRGRVLAQLVGREIGADSTLNTGGRNDSYGTALVEEFHEGLGGGRRHGRQNVPTTRWPRASTPRPSSSPRQPGRMDDHRLRRRLGEDGPRPRAHRQLGPGQDLHRGRLKSSSLPERIGKPATEGMRATAPTSVDAPAGASSTPSGRGGRRGPPDLRRPELRRRDPDRAGGRGRLERPGLHRREPAGGVRAPGDKYTSRASGGVRRGGRRRGHRLRGGVGPIDFDDAGDPRPRATARGATRTASSSRPTRSSPASPSRRLARGRSGRPRAAFQGRARPPGGR